MRTARKLVTVMGGGQTYEQRVLALDPWAYWPLDDAAGSTAAREVVNAWNSSSLTNVTFGTEGIGDGKTAATIGNAANDGIALNHTAFNANSFPDDEGTFLVWIKGSFVDGVAHSFATFTTSTNDDFYIEKRADNKFYFHRRDTTAAKQLSIAASADTDWQLFAQTWSVSGNALKGYLNGVPVGTTQTGLSAWSTALNGANLGKQSGANGAGCVMAHAALFSRALTDEELLNLATRPGGG